MAAAGDERYLVCAASAAGVVLVPPLCSAAEWLFLSAEFCAFLEAVVADRIGMATWLLSSGVATCVDTCRFAT